ncbi:MAG: DUF4430 domain-containing protein [Bacteroidota bacterium]
MKNSKRLSIVFYFIVFLFAQSTLSQKDCTNCSVTSCSSVSVAYTYNGNTTTYSNIPWLTGMNVTVAMLNAQQAQGLTFTTKAYCPYGSYLVSINGIYGGSSYWQLQINGIIASKGMDFQELNAGDQINWVMTSTKNITKDSISHQNVMASLHIKNVIDE